MAFVIPASLVPGSLYRAPGGLTRAAYRLACTEREQERLNRRWANVAAEVGTEKRLRLLARDLVEHLESRVVGMYGKAMIVCMSRRTCVALHSEIVKLRPDWRSDETIHGPLRVATDDTASFARYSIVPATPQRRRDPLHADKDHPNGA